MEVAIPPSPQDFDFTINSALTTPYSSPPATPRRFGDYFFSAPTSPSRMSDFYQAFDDEFSADIYATRSPPAVPYEWQFNPGLLNKATKIDDDADFAFNFSKDLERSLLSADELFDGGKIKPMEPPAPRFKASSNTLIVSSIRSPRSPSKAQKKAEKERGRERISTNSAAASLSGSNSGRRTTRSLSPLRVSHYPWELEDNQDQQPQQKVDNHNKQQNSATVSKPSSSSSSSTKGSFLSSSRKWRLRDLLLFRSASEGRASDKDPLRKYSVLYGKKVHEEAARKNGSLQSTDSFGSTGARRKGSPAVSAHERHYMAKKAASEDLKKKTFLPYKQGILGRLAFNPSLHALANGFGSLTRSSK